MNYFLYIFLLLGFLNPVFAQTVTFSKIYNIQQTDRPATVVPIDSQLLLVGGAAIPSAGFTGFGAIKTDQAGNEIWRIKIDSIEQLRLNVVTYNGQYAFAAINDLHGNDSEEKIIRIDTDGNFDFINPYQIYELFLTNPTIIELMKTPTGYLAHISERLELPLRFRQSILLYDEDFIPYNLYTYKEPEESFDGKRINLFPTGGYLVNGNLLIQNYSYQVIRKIDNSGNTEWTYELPFSYGNLPKSVSAVNESGEIYVAYIEQILDNSYPFGKISAVIIKLDAAGNLLWENKLTDDNFMQPYNLTFTENGDLLIIGRGAYQIVNYPLGKVVRMDQEGNFIWERTYRDNYSGVSYCLLQNGFELDNGGLVFSGYLVDSLGIINNLYDSNFWLIKVDSNGCLVPDDCGYFNEITSVTEIEKVKKSAYFLRPAIAQNSITLEKNNNETATDRLSISVVNISGQQMFSRSQEVLPYKIEVADFPSGLYFVNLTNEKGHSQTLKFIKN